MRGLRVNTGGPTMGWVEDPDGRGTVTILTSCLLTLGLCVWSAMHLDIPPRRVSQLGLWFLYFKWSLIGVLGPELVVYVAWRQLNSARALKQELEKKVKPSNKKQDDLEERALTQPNERDFALIQGFFGSMGGYAFDLGPGCDKELASCMPSNLSRLTVTAKGVVFLAQCGLLPEISREEIQDKNKADHLAKTVVCIQAGWFLAQTFARAAQHLHVTLLEVNTLGHVICALFVYLLWWNKPSMIYEPVYLTGDWVPSVCSYMYMSSQISIWGRDRPGFSRRAWLDSELSALTYVKSEYRDRRFSNTCNHGDPCACSPPQGHLQPRNNGSHASSRPERVALTRLTSDDKVSNPKPTDLRRWNLAVKAIENYSAPASRMTPATESNGNDVKDLNRFNFTNEELVTEYSSNWPSEHLLRGTEGLVMGMILWSASMAFGAIHLAAWRDHFPTVIEGWLWRASALWIAGSGAIWILINMLAKLTPPINRFWEDVVAMKVGLLPRVVLLVLCGFCGAAYVLSRLFLVVDAFLSLRALPPSAFMTPEWSQLFPHL